jgi:hypothetical protein
MKTIKLDEILKTPKGENAEDYVDTNSEGSIKRSKRTLRENLLRLLGSTLPERLFISPKEYTWVYNLCNDLNTKEKTTEISDDKFEFLKKILSENTFIIQTRDMSTGQIKKEEIKLYSPFEVGQMLTLLDGDK